MTETTVETTDAGEHGPSIFHRYDCTHDPCECPTVEQEQTARDVAEADLDVDPPIAAVRVLDYVWCLDKREPHNIGDLWHHGPGDDRPCSGKHRHLWVRVLADEGQPVHEPEEYVAEKRSTLDACIRDAERMLASHRGNRTTTRNWAADLLRTLRRYDGLETRMRDDHALHTRRREIEHDRVCDERNTYREALRAVRRSIRGVKIPRL